MAHQPEGSNPRNPIVTAGCKDTNFNPVPPTSTSSDEPENNHIQSQLLYPAAPFGALYQEFHKPSTPRFSRGFFLVARTTKAKNWPWQFAKEPPITNSHYLPVYLPGPAPIALELSIHTHTEGAVIYTGFSSKIIDESMTKEITGRCFSFAEPSAEELFMPRIRVGDGRDSILQLNVWNLHISRCNADNLTGDTKELRQSERHSMVIIQWYHGENVQVQ
ncbi:hypothetical protein JAAARDRAFT_43314 [Jaapia argillacea MUCL 33604]|uniref:Uncharacterized protein n=1 Tax=Jaapia argillacea MUCL 33604 TaxID=933084 RepID=A0A067QAN9_9AGAM|nr:hypothetical protein JAAARDRAFT_43314 [Jaapia argillacea MUCL 33604]